MRKYAFIMVFLTLLICAGCAAQPGAQPTAAPTNAPSAAPAASAQAAQGFEMHVIDVGKADCILIKCDGRSMLVDTGEAINEPEIRAYLDEQGIIMLDLLVATHPDKDHIGGMPWVLDEYEVAQAWLCPLERDSEPYMLMMAALTASATPVERPMAGKTGALGGAQIEVLSPNAELLADGDKNECSLVMRITYGGTRFLLMADAQKDAEDYLLDSGYALDADVIKIGHHGSDKATKRKLLEAVRPAYALISGDDPDGDVLDKLAEAGIAVLRTDLDGSIVVRSDGQAISIDAGRMGELAA